MKALTELILRVTDLAEAEGRVLRAMTVRAALSASIIVVAAGVSFVGLFLMLGSAYLAVADWLGQAGAAAFAGVLALAIGGSLVWLGHRIIR